MPTPIILDTDMGSDVDDALCLALAVAAPELSLLAVTHVTRDTRLRARLSRHLLDLAGRSDVPVFAGAAAPRSGPIGRFVWFGHEGEDFVDPTAAPLDISPASAVEAMARILGTHNDVELVAVGPLTNIAALFDAHPGLLPRIRRLTIMGGHLRTARSHGRTFPPGIDYNLCSDPAAALVVLRGTVPIRLVPIEVTLQVWLTVAHVLRLEATRRPVHTALAAAVRRWRAIMHGRLFVGGIHADNAAFLHDPLALACVYDESFCRFEMLHVDAMMIDGVFRTIERPAPSDTTRPLWVATAVDAARFCDHATTRLLSLGVARH